MMLHDWRDMFVASTKAVESAAKLAYEPMDARCCFYRGIALYRLKEYWAALEDLTFARACIGIYKEEKELERWIRKAQIATTKSPSKRRFGDESRTPDTTRTAPVTPASTLRGAAQALAQDLGSALLSGKWGSFSLSRPGPSSGRWRGASIDRWQVNDEDSSSSASSSSSAAEDSPPGPAGTRKRRPRAVPVRKRSIRFVQPPPPPMLERRATTAGAQLLPRASSLRKADPPTDIAARRRAQTLSVRFEKLDVDRSSTETAEDGKSDRSAS